MGVLTRRRLLGALAPLALSGCALVPPGSESTRAPSPTATPLPGQAALLALQVELDAARTSAWSAGQADLLRWALSVVADQRAAVHVPSPTPTPAPTPTLTPTLTPTPAPTSATPLPAPDAAAVVAALLRAAEAFGAQALDAATAQPVVWASMAAWAAGVAAQFPAPTAGREPARGVLLPAPQDAAAAVQAAADAAAAALFGLQVAAGAPGLTDADAARFDARLAAWQGLRDALAATASASPQPGPAFFEVDRPADAVSSRALAARLEASAQEVLGRSVAYGPAEVRPLLVQALRGIGQAVPAWGGLLQRWPGLPLP